MLYASLTLCDPPTVGSDLYSKVTEAFQLCHLSCHDLAGCLHLITLIMLQPASHPPIKTQINCSIPYVMHTLWPNHYLLFWSTSCWTFFFCSPVLQDYCSLDLAVCWFSRRQLSSVYLPSCVLSLDLLTALHQLIHLNKLCSKFYSLLQDLFFTNHDILMAFRSFFIYFFILMYSVVEHSVCFEKYIVIIKYFLELLLNASLISPTSY